jgi:MacB-like periplasmic core domain
VAALGSSANTAIFSLFNSIMLRTLPVEHQLIQLKTKYPGAPRVNAYWSWRSYEHFRDHNHVFSALTGTSFDNLLRVQTGNSEPESVIGENVLGDYFPVLSLKPAIGRLIGPEDVAASGAATVAVVSSSTGRQGSIAILRFSASASSCRTYRGRLSELRREDMPGHVAAMHVRAIAQVSP